MISKHNDSSCCVLFTLVTRLPVTMPDNSDYLNITTCIGEHDLKQWATTDVNNRNKFIDNNIEVLVQSVENYFRNTFDLNQFKNVAGLSYYEGTIKCRAFLAVSGKWTNAHNLPAPIGEVCFELPIFLISAEYQKLFTQCFFGCLANLSSAVKNNFNLILKILDSTKYPAKI